MFLSFYKYVNYYKRHKIVPKKMFVRLTLIMKIVPKMVISTLFFAKKANEFTENHGCSNQKKEI